MNKQNWVTVGSCLGFLFLGSLAVISDVGLDQLILRAIVGALVGGLAGWGMTRFLQYEPPRPPVAKTPVEGEEFVPLDLADQAEVVDRDSEHT